ncbi:MAG: hypothetical protein NT150_13510 [Bacteroidetes bacterium]|nr:hypothetical protein [Bacteroidota bacterium]
MKQNPTSTDNHQIQVQREIFEEIKEKIKRTDTSLVDDLAALLNVSTDSAYRRIRCDKFITIDELEKICRHYKISYDKHLAHLDENNVVFKVALKKETLSFDAFLTGILADLKQINSYPDHKLIYSAKEIPIFHFFQIPELAAFKMFYWMKTLFQLPEYENVSFSPDFVSPKYLELSKQLSEEYSNANTYEIWNHESIHSILAQIEFYFESGFMSREMALKILDKVRELVVHIKKQAGVEYKFPLKGSSPAKPRNYYLFNNEIILSDNTIYAQYGSESKCYIPHALLYYMSTTDQKYCDHIHNVFNGVISKSTMISGVAEKHRSIFFNYLLQRIEEKKIRLEK